jgi:hypothetical protein
MRVVLSLDIFDCLNVEVVVDIFCLPRFKISVPPYWERGYFGRFFPNIWMKYSTLNDYNTNTSINSISSHRDNYVQLLYSIIYFSSYDIIHRMIKQKIRMCCLTTCWLLLSNILSSVSYRFCVELTEDNTVLHIYTSYIFIRGNLAEKRNILGGNVFLRTIASLNQ